jgi:hypothetical protein
VSLILDALRKLDREKQSPDPGVVVVGPVPWGAAERRRRGWVPRLAAALVVLGAAGVLWWRLSPPARPAASGSTSSAPANGSAAKDETSLARPSASLGLEAPSAEETTSDAARTRAPVLPPAPRTLDLPPTAEAPPPPAPEVSRPAPARPRALQLTAISVRDGHPVALLNDHLVREGDSFDGIKVIRIGETEVEVEIDGKRRVVGF